MKNFLLLLTIAFASNFIANGQTVSLSDTMFKTGDKLPIRPIFFDLDKSNILTESYPYLDSIADFLIKNNNLCVEVGVHSDTRWSDQYSTCLTCNRAKAIVNYLISKGIEPDRLQSKGYNDKELLISDDDINKLKTIEEKEKAHQMNRRVEFKIISTDYTSGTVSAYSQDLYTSRKGFKLFPGHLEIVITVNNKNIRYELFNHWYSNSYEELRQMTIPLDSLDAFNLKNDSLKITLLNGKVMLVDKKYQVSQKVKHRNLCESVSTMRKISYAYKISSEHEGIRHFDLYKREDLKLDEEEFKKKVMENLIEKTKQ